MIANTCISNDSKNFLVGIHTDSKRITVWASWTNGLWCGHDQPSTSGYSWKYHQGPEGGEWHTVAGEGSPNWWEGWSHSSEGSEGSGDPREGSAKEGEKSP